MGKLNSTSLAVHAEQKPGVVLFHNYTELKNQLSIGLEYYKNFEYSVENFNIAVANRDELKQIKKILEDKKKEIQAAYTAPYVDVEEKLEELLLF